jgi:hypothetical protein
VLELAERIQQRVLSPDSLAMYRLAVTEGPHFESLRHAMLKVGLEGFLERLARQLEGIAADGGLSIDDPILAAQRLLSLVQGQLLFAAACGETRRTSRPIRGRELERAVDAFVAIYRPA